MNGTYTKGGGEVNQAYDGSLPDSKLDFTLDVKDQTIDGLNSVSTDYNYCVGLFPF